MKYIKAGDYDYIMSKYHTKEMLKGLQEPKGEETQVFYRFLRHDAIFDEKTGMAGGDILVGIQKNAFPASQTGVFCKRLFLLCRVRPFPYGSRGCSW